MDPNSSLTINISKQAYSKLFLHLCRYPHLTCNGLLLANKGSNANNNKIDYVDCIPMFHASLSLAPSLEIAFVLVDAYCEKNSLEIAGYYQASENIHDNQ